MNKRAKRLIINTLIISVCIVFLFLRSGLYLSPMAAHKSSERSIHYGPSTVVHIEDFSKGKHLLGRYDKWVSCNTVLRKGPFWSFGSQALGFKNDINKPIDFSSSMSDRSLKLYGSINDKKISRIEIIFNNGTKHDINKFYDSLFLLSIDNVLDNVYCTKIVGYDINQNVVYTADVN